MKMICRALLLSLLASSLPAQAPVPASVRGVLLRWGTTEPVEQATVELRGVAGTSLLAITATRSNGEFEFANVAPGNYRVFAMGVGFATSEYGQLRPNGAGRSIRISAGERAGIRVAIVPGGVISGTITGENGQPMVYSEVRIFRIAYDSEGQLSPTLALTTLTNDLGEYRAFWLPPGQYLVNAGAGRLNLFGNQGTIDPLGSDSSIPSMFTSSPSRPRASAPPISDEAPASRIGFFSTLFHANAPDARNADVIELRVGAEVPGVNIRIAPTALPAAPVQLRGMVVDPNGAPVQGNFVATIANWPAPGPTTLASLRTMTTRVPATDPGQNARGVQIYVPDNGRFEGGAVPGVYQIRAVQGDFAGRTVLEVGNRDLDVRVQLRPSITVSGRVVIDGAATGVPEGIQVGLRTPPNFGFFAPVSRDGQFVIERVIPGDYQIYAPPIVPAPPRGQPAESIVPAVLQNAYVKSIRSGSTDLSRSLLRVEGTEPVPPLEIIVSLNAASLDGRVLKAGKPVTQATVVLLPDGPPPYRSDRYKTLVTDELGRYTIRGIPPGNYRLLAWEDVDPGAWFNAAFLALYERYAVPLQVAEGERRIVDIAVIPVTP